MTRAEKILEYSADLKIPKDNKEAMQHRMDLSRVRAEMALRHTSARAKSGGKGPTNDKRKAIGDYADRANQPYLKDMERRARERHRK